jgi:hypothetical protein
VTGSPVLAPDNATLLFYFGGQRGFWVSCVGPGSQTGVARLRRDGFAALTTTPAAGGVVTTRVLATNVGRDELFVNVNGTGGVTVEVLSDDGSVLLGPSDTVTGDNVTAHVTWVGRTRPLAPFSGKVSFRLRFTLGPDTQLFAFWTAVDACGASDGFVGGGGPGAPDGVDSRGRC